jgi:hypothetical protein
MDRGRFRMLACRSMTFLTMDAHSLLSHPASYPVLSESPVRADSKAGILALPDQLVNRGRVDAKHLADFLYREDFIIACHRIYDASLWECSPLWTTAIAVPRKPLVSMGSNRRLHLVTGKIFQNARNPESGTNAPVSRCPPATLPTSPAPLSIS